MSTIEGFRERLVNSVRLTRVAAVLSVASILGFLAARSTPLGIVAVVTLIGLSSALVWSEHLTRQRLVMTLLASSVLLPSMPIPELWNIRLEEILVLAFVPAVILREPWFWTRLDFFFALIGVFTLISMMWGVWLGVPFSPRDLMEVVKIAKYWLFFRFALHPWDETGVRKAVNCVLISMGIAALIGILQWQNWLGIGRPLGLLYGHGATHAEEGRVVGTMANPNQFALLMATGLGIAIGASKDSSLKRQMLLIGVGALLVSATIITESRTGAAGAVIVLAAGVSLRMWGNRSVRQRRVWLSAVLLMGVFLGFVVGPWIAREIQRLNTMAPSEILNYVRQGPFSTLLYRFSVVTSDRHGIGGRIEIWRSHWKLFRQSPILGWGPGKSRYETTVDSEYVLYLRRYGLIGMMCLLILYWHVFRFSWRLLRCRTDLVWRMGASIMAILATYLVANSVTSTFYDLQLMSFFWLIVGLGYSMLRFHTVA